MSAQKPNAFERAVVGGLSYKAGLAATLLDAWADMPVTSVQSVRGLIDQAQLALTEEHAAKEILLFRAIRDVFWRRTRDFSDRKNA